jgi:hypothetical protein
MTTSVALPSCCLMAYGVGQFENSPASSAQSSDSGYGSDGGDDDVGGPAVNDGDDADDEYF